MVAVLSTEEPISSHGDNSPVELPSLSSSIEKNSAVTGNRRFNLRKRSFTAGREVNMSSYNSAFLSGLFADVAKANDSTLEDDATVSTEIEDEEEIFESRSNQSLSVKRSRVSLSKSVSRVGRSYMDLTSMFETEPAVVEHDKTATTCTIGRMDSLHFQLNCVSNVSKEHVASPKSVMSVLDIGKRAFPLLPASVSDSSCSHDLTRKVDRAVSAPETSSKESYGWFVEMDDGHSLEVVDAYNDNAKDLAFSAATAPKRSDLDAELEWAKAADTVDDVLGDFF